MKYLIQIRTLVLFYLVFLTVYYSFGGVPKKTLTPPNSTSIKTTSRTCHLCCCHQKLESCQHECFKLLAVQDKKESTRPKWHSLFEMFLKQEEKADKIDKNYQLLDSIANDMCSDLCIYEKEGVKLKHIPEPKDHKH